MATENVSFELNSKTYDEFEKVCDELGLTTDEAFTLFARKMVNEQEIPFEVTAAETSKESSPARKILCLALVISSIAAAVALIKVLLGSKDRCPFHR